MAIEFYHISETDFDMIDQIVELEKRMSKNGSGLTAFEVNAYVRYGRVYAAVEYDEVVGCSYFMKDFDNPGKVYLFGLIVDPKEAGKKLGQNLLMSAFADLKDSSLRMAEVAVHPSNRGAIKVYRDELGFNIINDTDQTIEGAPEYMIMRRIL